MSSFTEMKLSLSSIVDKFAWKYGALRPQKPLRLIRDGEVGGSGGRVWKEERKEGNMGLYVHRNY